MAGNVYKYRAGTKAAAEQWCRYLQQAACGIREKPLPANLMSFEWYFWTTVFFVISFFSKEDFCFNRYGFIF